MYKKIALLKTHAWRDKKIITLKVGIGKVKYIFQCISIQNNNSEWSEIFLSMKWSQSELIRIKMAQINITNG